MAGHSKWANIKHKKAKEDAKRGKVFTKLIREITVVARDGGGDPAANPRLRLLIDKARHENMPNDNIDRAIKKGTGELAGAAYEQIVYEGYGPHGVALIIETLSDNKNRTVADVRHVFTKMGGNLAENGAVSWLFEHCAVVILSANDKSEDELLEVFLDAGVTDVQLHDGMVRLLAAKEDLFALKNTAEKAGFMVVEARLEWVAKDTLTLNDEHTDTVVAFLDKLDDLDDVQNVFSNLG